MTASPAGATRTAAGWRTLRSLGRVLGRLCRENRARQQHAEYDTRCASHVGPPGSHCRSVAAGRAGYDRISRPSASFMRFAIIDGAPLRAGAPVQEIISPCFTLLLVHP